MAAISLSAAVLSSSLSVLPGACHLGAVRRTSSSEHSGRRQAIAVRAQERESLGSRYTGYVEKDTAGQENVYAVEPTVYVSSSGTSSSSSTAVVAGVAVLVLVGAGAALVVLGNSGGKVSDVYDGPTLSSLVSKFEADLAAPSLVVEEVVEEVAVVEEVSSASGDVVVAAVEEAVPSAVVAIEDAPAVEA